MSSRLVTSPFAPDLGQVRAWLEKMVKAFKFVELITAIVSLLEKMAQINAELTRRLAHARRKHPRSETLERLGPPAHLASAGAQARSARARVGRPR